jgi:adenylate cyclase class 2
VQQEIEVKFLNVDHGDIRAKLTAIGATLEQPMRMMKRAIMDFPNRSLQSERDAYIRIRDEGDKIKLTYKQAIEHVFGGAHEIETTVGSLEKMRDIFIELGLIVHSFQESQRETWMLGDTEIVLDIWPWLDPLIEIEGPSENIVKDVAAKLGFDWNDAVFGTVVTAYRAQYPNMVSDKDFVMISEVKFDLPCPDSLSNGTPS